MDKIKLNEDNFKDIYLSKGGAGKCFITLDGNSVYKEFYEKNNKCFHPKEDSDVFVFPKALVYNHEEELTGYLMDYINGNTFNNLSSNFDLHVLIDNIKLIEQEILKHSLYFMTMIDLNYGNILIDENNRFRIIDTDGYYYRYDTSASDVYEHNMSLFSYTMIDGILFDSEDEQNKSYNRFKKKILNKERVDCYFGINKPSLFLENVLIELSNRCNELNNVGDLRSNLSRILKKS